MLTANDIPEITDVYAIVSTDNRGMQGIPAAVVERDGTETALPMVIGDARRLKYLRHFLQVLRADMPEIQFQLMRFSKAEILDE